VQGVVQETLVAQGRTAQRVLVTPAPLNTLLWRVVVMHEGGYDEGFYSLLDAQRRIRFDRFTSDPALWRELQHLEPVQRIAAFSQGFYKVHEEDGRAFITDLRMGQEPGYVFSFEVARRGSGWQAVVPQNKGGRMDIGRGLAWVWARMWGKEVAPAR
jgi:inner membrane protein